MKCPIDDAELVMTERQGVEIDYCPTCRGVWLDRGELDKILDRAVQAAPTAAVPPAAVPPAAAPQPAPQPRYDEPRHDRPREPYRDDDRYRDQHRDQYRDQPRDQYGRPYKKRKESWLGEIFDF